MSSVVKLVIAAAIPVAVAVLFWFLDTKTKFSKLPKATQQIIIGIVFGALAILGTEWGIPMNGAQINCRDAAPLIAGLLFGGPAGIIAGCIGGIERYIAVLWGVGTFTRVACSVSTVIAGIYAAILRKFLFEDKRPTWWISLAAGIVMEVFHLSMVFVTNMDEALRAAEVVRACTVPMIFANGLSVMFAAIVVAALYGDSLSGVRGKRQKLGISRIVQRYLFVTVLLAFFVTTVFIDLVQTNIAKNEIEAELSLVISDTLAQIDEYASSIKEQEALHIAQNRHVENTGYILIADENGCVLNRENMMLSDIGISNLDGELCLLTISVDDIEYFAVFQYVDDHYIVALISVDEAYESRDTMIYVNTFMEVLVFAVLFLIIYAIINKAVVNDVHIVNEKLQKITDGDLDTKVELDDSEEFAELSDDINTTVNRLKELIKEAEERIDAELEIAKKIQVSVLPGRDEAIRHNKHFDIYARMDTAKEVGGDFYDFYLSQDSKTLYFLMADVSGKGIPAAMFMMRAKAQIKSFIENGLSIEKAFEESNRALCEGNDEDMFVTAWMGALNLENGHVEFVNAGHNPPVLCKNGEKFEFIKEKTNFILAGMDMTKYVKQEFDLLPGDRFFLYTDGVTEATDKENKLFGDENLLTSLNDCESDSMKDLCDFVKEEVDHFVGEAPQFDDISMLSLRYNG